MIKVASLFSGAGGLDWGFHINPNYKIVFANDFNSEACKTYLHNFKDAKEYHHEGDISSLIDNIPPHDILLGGFPCQPFSLAGKRLGFEDPRGLELYNCEKALLKYQPKMFVFENVKGILSHDDGKTLELVLKVLNQCGYKIHHQLIKMVDYGVSQLRERVLFLGVRNDIDVNPSALVPLTTKKGKILSEVLNDLKDLPFGQMNHNFHVSTKVKQHWFKVLKEGENLNKLSEVTIRNRETELNLEHKIIPKTLIGYRRLDGSKVSPTMMFGNTCLPIHPTENRNLSVRECALIQGFPHSFEFMGGVSSQYKQVGNAVPPIFSILLAEHIAS